MKEYIVFYQNIFLRFSLDKPGLCVQKLENNRFSEKQILLSNAKEDFCALADDAVHIVCQSESGSIIYLTFDGKTWKKTVLLESKEGRAYRKYFNLLKLGNLVNLFYTINHEDKTLLIHQILDGTYSEPEVVDFVTPCGVRFCISEHISSDVSITYKNQNGVCGSKVYRWSKKSFMQFVPFTENTDFEPHFINITDRGTYLIGVSDTGDEKKVVFYAKNEFGESVKHELASGNEDFNPVFFSYRGKTVAEWYDRGCIMAATSEDDGKSFSAPVKYIKNAYSDISLFELCATGQKCLCYGLKKGNSITFYSAKDILSEMKNEKKKVKSVLKGDDAAQFAAQSGYKKTNGWDDDPYVTQKELKYEIEKIQKMIDDCRNRVEKIEETNKNDEKEIL